MPLLRFQPLNEIQAREIVAWRYPEPYDDYNLTSASIDSLINSCSPCYSILDEANQLVGFCSFGLDGQVPGGDYTQEGLDIGLGIHPDQTGQGKGREYVDPVIAFAKLQFAPRRLRVTIARFNQRAQKVWLHQGFQIEQSFESDRDGRPFVILTRET